jgi:phosphotriesterase-related protein
VQSSSPNSDTRRWFLKHALAAGLTVANVGRTTRAAQIDESTRASSSFGTGYGVVQTVLGSLDPSQLGFTLTHEHICKDASAIYGGRASSVAKAVDKLKEAKDAGIQSIVDVTTFDVGRDVRIGEEVSRRAGVHIVACTGQHMFAPESHHRRSVEEIAELFIKEIEHGIEDTDIKAGIIKVAARSGTLTQVEVNVFKAAARACKATGVPVTTHTNSRQRGGETQAAIFEEEGLSPTRVVLGHSNDTDDMSYLVGLAKRGYTLGMDHAFWGTAPGATLPWQRRVECVKELVAAGFGRQLFLSNDWVFGDAERDKINPDGLLYTTRNTMPYLRRIGVTGQAIRDMVVENPKHFFGRR